MHPKNRRVRRALAVVGSVLITWLAIPSTTSSVGGTARPESPVIAAPESSDWLAGARRSISEREYEATDAGAGLQAPNRAQGLRMYFDATGARVVDRENEERGLTHLRTVAVGRGEPKRVADGEVTADGARVEIRRAGLVETFENTELGLEQSWTLTERPVGDGALMIEVALGGTIASVEGDGATVMTAGGRPFEYGGLAAWDARGAVLATRMELGTGGRLRIVVEDAEAAYPVTVDPTLTQPAFSTLMGDQSTTAMGASVDGAGDVNNDGFDDVIIGAPLYDSGTADEGAAFVFLGGPNGIASGGPASASVKLESNQNGAQMGASVAGAGDVNNDGYDDVIVGATYYDAGQTDEGGAFVFLGGPAGIASGDPSTANTVLQSDQGAGYLGFSVDGSGDVNDDGYADVIVGAVFYDSGQLDEGAAFVFHGGPSGIPSGDPSTANTFLQGDQATSRFGVSVAGAGDTNGDGYADIIIGARLYDSGETDEGAAFVYLGGAAGIGDGSPASASATLQSNQGAAYFGAPVAAAGDVNNDGFDDVIVGSNSYDSGQTDEGGAFVFLGSASGIASGNPATASARLESNQSGALLGYSAAGAGDVNADGYDDVVVGANMYDQGMPNEGTALLFLGGPAGIASGNPLTSRVLLQSDQSNAQLGASVAGVGDVDNDGYDDIAVGAPTYDSGETDEGAAFVYLGAPDGLNGFPVANATIESNQIDANLGFSVAGAGDVNNDGSDDVIVGANSYDAGQTDEGAAFIFLGGPGGIGNGNPGNADTFLQADRPGANLGVAVDGAGDTNGDGYDDVIVGAYSYNGSGAAFVFFGGPNGVPNGAPATASAILQGDQAGMSMGESVAGAGDVNNDGYGDVIVGASFYDSGQTDEGAAFVFLGGPNGVGNNSPATADTLVQSDQMGAHLGDNVASAGDTNGDGYDDILVGASFYDWSQTDEGAAFVWLGGPNGVPDGRPVTANASLKGDHPSDFFGSGVDGAGDTNGDGYDDVVIGVPFRDWAGLNEGAVGIYLGGPSGVGNGTLTSADSIILSNQTNDTLGQTVAGAGDVNGDGFDDIIVSGSDGVSSSTRALVYLGGVTGVPNGTPRTAAATLRRYSGGLFLAGAGDVDNDGFDDVIIGAPSYANGQSGEGGAFVYHLQRPAVASGGSDTVGIYVAASGAWFLRNANAPGGADVVFTYGGGGSGLVALRGDWDGDGDDTPGLYAPSTGAFFLRNTNSPGGADVVFTFGAGGAGYLPMVGDWNGDGTDTIGLYAPTTSVFFLRNQNASGAADVVVGFGPAGAGWTPIAGDWDGNGTDTVGLFAPTTSTFFLRNANAPGGADVTFGFGPANVGWKPVVGDFDGDGDDTIGLYSGSNGFFFLRNANAGGAADLTFGYGPSDVTPLVGDWDGN